MIQLGEPLNRKKTIKCPSCGDRILYVLHDRKSGDRLRFQDVRFLQPTTVKNPLYCSKCDSPWINKSTGRLISQLTAQIKKLHSSKKDNRVFGLYIKKTDADILKMDSKRKADDTFKYFKPMIKDCKTSKIKPSDLIRPKSNKDKDFIPKAEDFFTMIHPVEYISITKLDFENKKIGIKRLGEEEKIYDLVIQHTPKGFESSFPFTPITGPGIPEMLKAEKVKKRTGYKASSIIIDECKPLTRRQIKEANESLNKLNARKPTKKRVTR